MYFTPLPLHEKIETIVFCFLKSGLTESVLGSVSRSDYGVLHIRAEGRAFTVRCVRGGWAVRCGDYEGVDRDLIEAARLALDP